jgi:hypothetical protein
MSGYIGKALSAFFREHEYIVTAARAVGEAVRFKQHLREKVTNQATGLCTHRWQVQFGTEAEAEKFDEAIRELVEAVSVGREES